MKKFLRLSFFRAVVIVGGFRTVTWFYGIDGPVAAMLGAHRGISTAILGVVLIWTHLIWDADKQKLKIAYDLRTHGIRALLRAKPDNPELPFNPDD